MTEENPYATPESEISVLDDGSQELASRWARLGGSLIDGILTIAIFWPVMYFLGMFDRLLEGQESSEDLVASFVLGILVYFLLNGYLLATRGQTIGKYFASTRIVSIQDKKILPLWKVILLRFTPVSILPYIPGIGQILGLVNVLIIFQKDRRCGHDHIAGTIVVKAE